MKPQTAAQRRSAANYKQQNPSPYAPLRMNKYFVAYVIPSGYVRWNRLESRDEAEAMIHRRTTVMMSACKDTIERFAAEWNTAVAREAWNSSQGASLARRQSGTTCGSGV